MKQVGGATVYMRDVAHVRDGFARQTNMVHVDGKRSALLTILKTPHRLHARHRAAREAMRCRASRRRCRRSSTIKLLFDQSVFVRAAVDGV